MPLLLDDERYFRFLAETHPRLKIEGDVLPDGRGAHLPTFVASLDTTEPLLDGPIKQLMSSFSQLMSDTILPPTLFIGTPFERYNQTGLLDRVEQPSRLAADATAIARERRLQLVVVTNVRPDHPAVARYISAGFVSLPSFPDTVIDLEPEWNEHLARLEANDRSGIRRNLKRFSRAGHQLERLQSSADAEASLFEAYRPMFERARVRWFPHTSAYFGKLASLDDRVHLTVARSRGREVIGFAVSFRDTSPTRRGDPVWFHAGRVGVHPDFHKKDAVYFALLYHLVQEAIAAGAVHLSMEPTGYRMKRHLGARAVPMVNLVLGVSPAWRALLRSTAPIGRRLLGHLSDLKKLEREY